MTQKLPGMSWTHPAQSLSPSGLAKQAMASFNGRPQRRAPADYPRAGLAMRFHVALDDWGTDLGLWSSCRGLQVQFTAKEIAQGGEYFDRDLLPDRIRYSAVTLERVMTQTDSPKVQEWLANVAMRWTGYEFDGEGDRAQYAGQSVTIRLFDHRGRVVSRWVLKNAMPKEWVGPDLNAQSNSVATEKISFEHSGFLQSEPSMTALEGNQ
ncbi:phage tail protein [Streptomyces sp. NPDC047981]|uniref:phage tail protein n=1 Tax=Streptomyces sp. NPDC047981 TaxID=3154610 RepID=UPI003421FFF6